MKTITFQNLAQERNKWWQWLDLQNNKFYFLKKHEYSLNDKFLKEFGIGKKKWKEKKNQQQMENFCRIRESNKTNQFMTRILIQ